MKKTIVVADRDEKVRQAFMTMFSKEQFAFFWACNGKEVEKLAARMNPDIYLVNIDLPKTGGIDVHRKLQKAGRLYNASFFFLKDETAAEPLGIEVDGVIEKPINFFRVYETLTSDDEVIELTDLVEEKTESLAARVENLEMEGPAPNPPPSGAAEGWPQKGEGTESPSREEPEPQDTIGRQLRQAMDSMSGGVSLEGTRGAAPAPIQSELEQQFKAVLNQAMQEAAEKLSGRLAPVLTSYVEDYVKQMLLELTEKVIREEIEKLLKESVA
jgi:CheY-like chemotaxis protein